MNFKSGFITIAGQPNVGKSTLLNSLLCQKIAAVTNKPQTTRGRILGIINSPGMQAIFVDTPGLHKGRNKLAAHMQSTATESMGDCDILIYMVSATEKKPQIDNEIIAGLKGSNNILIINKVDAVEKTLLLPIIDRLSKLHNFGLVLPMSAKNPDERSTKTLLSYIEENLPEGAAYYPEDAFTDQTERSLTAELIREKLMLLTHDELPYGIYVNIDKMQFNKQKDLTTIEATIVCEKQAHKPIVIGKDGEMLKQVGKLARADIEQMLGGKVFLQLWVKVDEDWRDNSRRIKEQFGN